jgi:hypothetical protein
VVSVSQAAYERVGHIWFVCYFILFEKRKRKKTKTLTDVAIINIFSSSSNGSCNYHD